MIAKSMFHKENRTKIKLKKKKRKKQMKIFATLKIIMRI
jgi:hypothetical protein